MEDQVMRIRLPASLKAWLKSHAKDNSRTMNGELLQLIKAAKRVEEGEAANGA